MAKKDNSNKEKKHFWKDFKAEIKKVIWPTPKQLVNSTVAIITMVIIVAVIVFVLDLAFDAFNKNALTSLQQAVQGETVNENTTTNDSADTDEEETTTDSSNEETTTAVDNSSNEEATEEEGNETVVEQPTEAEATEAE